MSPAKSKNLGGVERMKSSAENWRSKPGLAAEQARLLSVKKKGAMAVRIANSSNKGKYRGTGPDGSDHRVGANDFLKVPSRIGDERHYRRDSGVKK